MKHDLVLYNDGSSIRIDLGQGLFICIYLTLTSPQIASEIGGQVLNDTWGSDHFPILISVIGSNENYKNAEFKFVKADWEEFKCTSEVVTLADVFDQNINNNKLTDTFLSIARETERTGLVSVNLSTTQALGYVEATFNTYKERHNKGLTQSGANPNNGGFKINHT